MYQIHCISLKNWVWFNQQWFDLKWEHFVKDDIWEETSFGLLKLRIFIDLKFSFIPQHFLRELPDSPIPCEFFQKFMNIALRFMEAKTEADRAAPVAELTQVSDIFNNFSDESFNWKRETLKKNKKTWDLYLIIKFKQW